MLLKKAKVVLFFTKIGLKAFGSINWTKQDTFIENILMCVMMEYFLEPNNLLDTHHISFKLFLKILVWAANVEEKRLGTWLIPQNPLLNPLFHFYLLPKRFLKCAQWTQPSYQSTEFLNYS